MYFAASSILEPSTLLATARGTSSHGALSFARIRCPSIPFHLLPQHLPYSVPRIFLPCIQFPHRYNYLLYRSPRIHIPKTSPHVPSPTALEERPPSDARPRLSLTCAFKSSTIAFTSSTSSVNSAFSSLSLWFVCFSLLISTCAVDRLASEALFRAPSSCRCELTSRASRDLFCLR